MNGPYIIQIQYTFFNNTTLLKLKFSEKAAKIWKISHLFWQLSHVLCFPLQFWTSVFEKCPDLCNILNTNSIFNSKNTFTWMANTVNCGVWFSVLNFIHWAQSSNVCLFLITDYLISNFICLLYSVLTKTALLLCWIFFLKLRVPGGTTWIT